MFYLFLMFRTYFHTFSETKTFLLLNLKQRNARPTHFKKIYKASTVRPNTIILMKAYVSFEKITLNSDIVWVDISSIFSEVLISDYYLVVKYIALKSQVLNRAPYNLKPITTLLQLNY